LDFTKENLCIFSREVFEKRLRAINRYDELASDFDSQITIEKVEQDIEKLNGLPISGLKAWRNRILSHLDKDSVKDNINIAKKYPVKTRHIAEIIETLDNMLNDYCLAFDFSTHYRGLAIEGGIKYILDAIRFRQETQKKSR